MTASVTCPKCGAINEVHYGFCTRCGTVLTGAKPTAVAGLAGGPSQFPATQPAQPGTITPVAPPRFPSGPPGMPWGYAWGAWAERTKQVDRTKTGLLLLIIGTLLGPVPFVGIVGSILDLIGLLLVFLGRKAFGPGHARNAVISVALIIFGIVAAVVLSVILVAALFGAVVPGTPPSQVAASIVSAFNTFLVGLLVVTAITGLWAVLLTYALQRGEGRALLWGAYASNVALQVAILLIVGPIVGDVVGQSFAGGTFNPAPLEALQGRIELLDLFGAVPALLASVAYYLAWSRIKRGEIPPPLVPPPVPAPLQAAPPLA